MQNPKNILYVVTKLPWPLIGGDRVHIYNYLKELKKRGYNITLVTLVADTDDIDGAKQHNEFYTKLIPVKFNKKLAYLNAVKAVFNDKPFIVEYFYNNEMQKVIDEEVKSGKYDVIIGYMTRSIPYIKKFTNMKKIIHICDSYTMLYKKRFSEQKNLFDKFKIWVEYLKTKHYESLACDISDKQILIAQKDKECIESFAKKKDNLTVINWTTDTDYFKPIECELKNNICMVGSWQYIPNTEAAVDFIRNVFSLVKKEIPDAVFKVIGANPRPELYDAAKEIEGVVITGRVDDVREYMKDCKVSVCPTKIVSGMQTKILEAMSMGIPIVTTPESAEGVWKDKSILSVGENYEDYAQKVIKLLKDDNFRSEISKKSREFIMDNLTWEKIGNDWEKIIQEVTNG